MVRPLVFHLKDGGNNTCFIVLKRGLNSLTHVKNAYAFLAKRLMHDKSS